MGWSSFISFKSNHKIKLMSLLPWSYLRCSSQIVWYDRSHPFKKLLVLSHISVLWAVSSSLLAAILLKTHSGKYCKSGKTQGIISLVKHEQSQEQDSCDYLQVLWSTIFLVTGVVNCSIEKTVTWWAMCWPSSSELQKEWNARREWMNLFIIEIKSKTLQFLFNLLTSLILFDKKSFILWLHDCLPTYIFSLTFLLAHMKMYLFIRETC